MTKQFGSWEKSSQTYKYSCYENHPVLKFTGRNGKEYKIYGGSCAYPVVKDADVYIGFNHTVSNPNEKSLPWEDDYKPVVIVNYPISDMKVPSDVQSFHKLVDWTCNQLQAGKKVHAGCMGGHGRTGMFLVAVVASMTGMIDAIQYVRKNYCYKAVETSEQIQFLVKEFGVAKAPEVKKFEVISNTDSWNHMNSKVNGYQGSSGGSKKIVSFADAKRTIKPVKSEKIIW
jgi:protein-tyrosine phosphatase